LVFSTTSAWAAEKQQPLEDHYFNSNGVKIHYFVRGEGEPVLLIHGFTASADSNWIRSGIFDALDDHYKVIAIDNRGHGKSEKPHDADKYGMEMVEDQIRLLDHLGIDKAHLVGYSMGGFITGRLMIEHPERVLSATMGGAGWEDQKSQRLDFIEELADSLESGKGIGPLIVRLTPAGETPPNEEQLKLMNTVVMMTNDPQALAAVIRGMTQFFVPEDQLRACKVPVLAIVGSRDPLKAGVDAMAKIRPDIKVVVVDGANHMTAFRKPVFIDSLKAFLAKHSRATAKPQPVAAGAG